MPRCKPSPPPRPASAGQTRVLKSAAATQVADYVSGLPRLKKSNPQQTPEQREKFLARIEAVKVSKQKYVLELSTLPLDFSFCNIASLVEIPGLVPRSGPPPMVQRLRGQVAKSAAQRMQKKRWLANRLPGQLQQEAEEQDAEASVEEESDEDAQEQAEKAMAGDTTFEALASVAAKAARIQNRHRKVAKHICVTKTLRLHNNEIVTLDGFDSIFRPVLLRPQILQWVDVSFNRISKVEPIVHNCPRLQLLYAHVNFIRDPAQLDLIGTLKHLKALTLNGNPLEKDLSAVGYRFRVAAAVPSLQKLDFSSLTILERDTGAVWRSKRVNKRLLTPRTELTQMLASSRQAARSFDKSDTKPDTKLGDKDGNGVLDFLEAQVPQADSLRSRLKAGEEEKVRWHGHRLTPRTPSAASSARPRSSASRPRTAPAVDAKTRPAWAGGALHGGRPHTARPPSRPRKQ